MPLPFVLVQRRLNRASLGRPAVPLARIHPVLAHGLTAVGLAVFVLSAWSVDSGEVRYLWTRREIPAGAIRGTSAIYELDVTGRNWVSLSPGTIGDAEADLELRGPGADTWVIAYVRAVASGDIGSIVSERRVMIFGEGEPLAYAEERYFLAEADLVPVSLARYQVSQTLGAKDRYVVLTVELKTHLIEIIGHAMEDRSQALLVELLSSFRPVEPDAERT
jgi:hypothetical protein